MKPSRSAIDMGNSGSGIPEFYCFRDIIEPLVVATRTVSRETPSGMSQPPTSTRAAETLSAEQKLSGEMLLFTTAFMMCATMLWLAIYWSMGYKYSMAIPFTFQACSIVTMLLYWRFRKLQVFALLQLGLILFTPFAMQWSIGNFVNSSGVSLWGLLAPVGAVTVLGTRDSVPWFFAWLFMTVLAGVFDFMLAPELAQQM